MPRPFTKGSPLFTNYAVTLQPYNLTGFHSSPLTNSDIEAKPIVLLIGQYSTVSILGSLLTT